jgi:hypothetical protein
VSSIFASRPYLVEVIYLQYTTGRLLAAGRLALGCVGRAQAGEETISLPFLLPTTIRAVLDLVGAGSPGTRETHTSAEQGVVRNRPRFTCTAVAKLTALLTDGMSLTTLS